MRQVTEQRGNQVNGKFIHLKVNRKVIGGKRDR